MKLNKDQTGLMVELSKFWNSPRRQYFVLSGQAGVGKTTCMRFFKDHLKDISPDIKICMSAPTNQAVKVLANSVADEDITFKTVYSILGLRMQANGEVKELADSGSENITSFDLVVVDESSMINSVLIDYILKKTALSDTKIIFIGDRQQLPPVGEEISPIWTKFKTDYELIEVMRHQNSILDFVQHIRGNRSPKIESPGEQVIVAEEDSFTEKIIEIANRGDFHKGKAKAIAWRNMTVEFLNRLIRDNNSTTKSSDKFVVGDRIVFKEPLVNDQRFIVATTDEEGTITSAEVTRHAKYPTLKAWKLKISLDCTNSNVTAYVIHQESEKQFNDLLDGFKANKRWDLFWKLKEAFNNIAYAYALTAHRSQGSTFPITFVDIGDIQLNRNVDERVKCLYVACSRASKELWLFP